MINISNELLSLKQEPSRSASIAAISIANETFPPQK